MQRSFKPRLNTLQNYAISALYLSIGLRMRHRCHIEPDFGTAAKLRQLTDGKVCAIVSDNDVRNAEPGSYSTMNFVAVAPSSFLMGFASTHFVNLSTATSR